MTLHSSAGDLTNVPSPIASSFDVGQTSSAFLCSDAASQLRGVALPIEGG
jgi:hypothetical protein